MRQIPLRTYLPHFLFRHTTMREKNFVHLNLCIALLLGCIIFVGGLETAKDNKVSFLNILHANIVASNVSSNPTL